MTRWQRFLPPAISLGLVAWLMTRLSPAAVIRAAAALEWQLLIPMTAALVAALYLWDAYCLPLVFSKGKNETLGYSRMLRVRGQSYLLGAFNQGLGQGLVAWNMARLQRTSLAATLSRSVVLLWHEVLILAAVMTAGSWLINGPRAPQARAFSMILVAVLASMVPLWHLLPARLRLRLKTTRWGQWIDSWTWRRSGQLIVVRLVYFALVGSYVSAALWICGLKIAPSTALAVIPLVLMAGVLPSASGLGNRETALYLLLRPPHPEVLVAMGLIWSSGILLGRLGIGLAWLWLGQQSRNEVPHENCAAFRQTSFMH